MTSYGNAAVGPWERSGMRSGKEAEGDWGQPSAALE